MNQDEFLKILRKGESETIEWKENFDKDTIETAVAFSNTKGGLIIVGITDGGSIKGVQLGKGTMKGLVNRISQSTNPRIIPDIERVIIEGKDIVVILIKEFPLKPVSVRGKCFRRVSNSNRVMTPQEISDMHLQSTGMSWDKLIADDISIEDIDFEKVLHYIKRANNTGRKTINDKEKPIKVLEKLELVKDRKPTWGAVLLFCKNDKHLLTQSAIHCGRFKEETVVVDDRLIKGTLIQQIEETMDFIQKNINVKFIMTGKPERNEIWDYPLVALREAMINAVCHRDYTVPSNIEVRIYDVSLSIWNPGKLPLGITIEDLFKPHSSVLRNKGIGTIFYDIGLIEQWGSGIDRMRKECTMAGLPEPKFQENQGFSVVFRKDIYTEEYLKSLGLNNRQIKAIYYLKEKGSINISSLKSIFPNVTDKTLFRDLKDLVKKKILQEEGVKKGRKYLLR